MLLKVVCPSSEKFTIPSKKFELKLFSYKFPGDIKESSIMRHVKFLARTVLVANNNIEEACRVLNRILGKEDIFDQFRRTRFYEKPYQVSSN